MLSFLTSSVSGTWLRDVVHLVVVVLVKYLLILFVPSLERVTAGDRVGLSQRVGPTPVFPELSDSQKMTEND